MKETTTIKWCYDDQNKQPTTNQTNATVQYNISTVSYMLSHREHTCDILITKSFWENNGDQVHKLVLFNRLTTTP